MICDRCGTDTVTWQGPLTDLTHTKCSTCGGTNCQRAEYVYPDEADDGDCWNCGGEGYVSSCFEEWACVDPEGGCDQCTRRCEICNQAPRKTTQDATP